MAPLLSPQRPSSGTSRALSTPIEPRQYHTRGVLSPLAQDSTCSHRPCQCREGSTPTALVPEGSYQHSPLTVFTNTIAQNAPVTLLAERISGYGLVMGAVLPGRAVSTLDCHRHL
eukprot:1818607-Rhodomonas_salina.1